MLPATCSAAVHTENNLLEAGRLDAGGWRARGWSAGGWAPGGLEAGRHIYHNYYSGNAYAMPGADKKRSEYTHPVKLDACM
jgi:hypothetical protein